MYPRPAANIQVTPRFRIDIQKQNSPRPNRNNNLGEPVDAMKQNITREGGKLNVTSNKTSRIPIKYASLWRR